MNTSDTIPRVLLHWILAGTAAMTAILAWSVMAQDLRMLYAENHMMEHLQLAILALVTWAFWRSDWCEMDEAKQHQRRHLRWLAITATVLGISFILREMSVKQSGIDWLIYFVDGFGFKLVMLALWLPLLVNLLINFRHYWQLMKQAVNTRFFMFAMMSLALLLVGAVFDKESFQPEFFRFYEEAAELNAYAWLLASALSFQQDIVIGNQEEAELELAAASS